MAISFQKKINYNYYITIFLITLLVLAGLYFLFKYFIEGFIIEAPLEEPAKPEVEINFKVLENPDIKMLIPFQEIKPFEESTGRDNPFLPY